MFHRKVKPCNTIPIRPSYALQYALQNVLPLALTRNPRTLSSCGCLPHLTISDSCHSTMKQCIDICRDCERACLETISYCLAKGGKLADPARILVLQNCADMCATCSKFMISGSKLHTRVCSMCSEVCTACARDCMNMQEDAQLAKCMESCHCCAKSCGKMGAFLDCKLIGGGRDG